MLPYQKFIMLCLLYIVSFLFIPRQEILASKAPMIIALSADFPPYSMVKKNTTVGILRDILEEALSKRMKLKIKFVAGPWERMQNMVKEGKADALCTVPNKIRTKYTIPNKIPLRVGHLQMYSGKNNPNLNQLKNIKNINDLKQGIIQKRFIIGTYLGSKWIKKYFDSPSIKIETVATQNQLVKMLKYNRIDVFINNSDVQRYILKKIDTNKNIVELPLILDKDYFHLLIRKNSPYKIYIKKFDLILKTMFTDGSIKNLLNKSYPRRDKKNEKI